LECLDQEESGNPDQKTMGQEPMNILTTVLIFFVDNQITDRQNADIQIADMCTYNMYLCID
jgi:hypothetical protein